MSYHIDQRRDVRTSDGGQFNFPTSLQYLSGSKRGSLAWYKFNNGTHRCVKGLEFHYPNLLYKISKAYFLKEIKILLLNCATSILKNYVSLPRSFV